MTERPDPIEELIALHRGLERQGPGDDALARDILRGLPRFDRVPRVVDLGCGSGAGTMLLAETYRREVVAVDACRAFLDDLVERAARRGLDAYVSVVCADFGALGFPEASFDLLWSEGAAYVLGFEHALTAWRPLLSPGAFAVVSEMSWFDPPDAAPAALRAYWRGAYAAMGTEAENVARAERSGFRVIETRRLSEEAWWRSYYGPLVARLRESGPSRPYGREVVEETEREIAFFERYARHYGYTFYVMQAT